MKTLGNICVAIGAAIYALAFIIAYVSTDSQGWVIDSDGMSLATLLTVIGFVGILGGLCVRETR